MTDTDEEGQQESWACRCGSAAGLKASQEHSERGKPLEELGQRAQAGGRLWAPG